MDGLRGREKRKIQSLGESLRGKDYPMGVYPRGLPPRSAPPGEGRHPLAGEPPQLLLELGWRQPFGPVDHALIEAGIAGLDLADRLDHLGRTAHEPRLLLDAIAQREHARGRARRAPRAPPARRP